MWVYRCPECPTTVSLGMAHPSDPPRCWSCANTGVGERGRIMYAAADAAKALLPLDRRGLDLESGPEAVRPGGLAPLKVEHLHRAGILLPETQDALEWLYRHRETNGMAEAFSKVGGRRCIDLVAFARLMREKRA